ncbi:hypothetical protein WJX72_006720 [[Myrmecia] bisecta]|uniref:Uncharacterized protein n=1 Tax=[Myrmecia] bisecta TaxID=41462 RepID=A0AAW1PQA4_9CHLO
MSRITNRDRGVMAISAATFGAPMALCLLADATTLLTAPFTLPSLLQGKLVGLQLRAIQATWRLLRGRRDRPRPAHREPQGEPSPGHASAEQGDGVALERVIVGVLLFTPLLLLLPTTLVYLLCAALLRLAIATATTALCIAAELLHCNPGVGLLMRMLKPGAFPGGIYVDILETRDCAEGSQPELSWLRLRSKPAGCLDCLKPAWAAVVQIIIQACKPK